MEFTRLLSAIEDETVRRWVWNQLPEHARLTGNTEDFLVESLRLTYDPVCDEWLDLCDH